MEEKKTKKLKKEVTPEEMENRMVSLRKVIDFCISKLSWVLTIIILVFIVSSAVKTEEYQKIKKASETVESREEYLLQKQRNILENEKKQNID